MPRRIIQSNISLSHPLSASDEITDNNSRSRRAITSEGGHTNDASSVTSGGFNALTKTLSPQLVPSRLLRHGHCPHDYRPGKSPLVPAAPSQFSHSPRHRKINGIRGTYERPLSTTTLETRLWQQMRAPFPRHSRHPWNRHMFLYQTHQRPEIQKDHLRQNSLRLQTSQERKGTRPANRGWRQTRLLQRHRNFHGRHHNIQDPNKQHPLHRVRRHDDDGHKELLSRHSAATV
jgi:hypothetical protein